MRSEKINAFVMMPFHREFDPIYKCIESACWSRGVFCDRADQSFFSEAILEHVQQRICKADILIADITGKNPNVFYEIGYAHAAKKSVILIAKAKEDIPFDVQQYQVLIYQGNVRLLRNALSRNIDGLANGLRPRKIIRLAKEVDGYLEYQGFAQASFKKLRSVVSEPCADGDFENLINVMRHYYTDVWIKGGLPGLVQTSNKRYWP